MAHPNTKCKVCGGSDFVLDAGYFFCIECNTQSQDVREEVYDEYFGKERVTKRVLQRKYQSRENNLGQNKLTSWEVLNFVLKGIVDELINLGAAPELKVVVLQLWAAYLRKQEVAFTSLKIERKPKFGYAFKQGDVRIIHGLTKKVLREKSWRSRSRSGSSSSRKSSSQSSSASEHMSDIDSESWASSSGVVPTRRSVLRRLASQKKALATAEYSQSQDSVRSVTRTLEDLESTSEAASSVSSSRMRVTEHTKTLLRSLSNSSVDSDEAAHRRILQQEIRSLQNITTAKLVVIVNIALGLLHQDIQMSDFFRWVEEGHISLSTSRKFLPEDTKLDSLTLKTIELQNLSYAKCQGMMSLMCRELDVDILPLPNLSRLAERYCMELQLPGELTEMVKKMLVLITSADNSSRAWNRLNCETLVMASIIVVMKLLFSLDDCTEYRLSHTVAQLNRLKREEESPLLLFSWYEWMQFIECRKAVVAAHHQPTRWAVYGETMGRDPQLFAQHYKLTAADLPDLKESSTITLKKEWVEIMSDCLKKLMSENPDVEETPLMFPPSLTPLHSCTQVLLTYHAERVKAAEHVLRQDFTSHTLHHITAPDQVIAFGLANDINISRTLGAAADFKNGKIIVGKENGCPVIPKFKVNQVNFTVNIVDKLDKIVTNKSTNNSENENEQFLNDFNEIISDCDDSEDESDDAQKDFFRAPQVQNSGISQSSLELFNSATKYWLSHIKLYKSHYSSEDFELFATKTLSSSFLWLLKECSRTIGVPCKELYYSVTLVEKQHKYLVWEANFLRTNKQNGF